MRLNSVLALLAITFVGTVSAAPIEAGLAQRDAIPEAAPDPAADPDLEKKQYGSYSPYSKYGSYGKLAIET